MKKIASMLFILNMFFMTSANSFELPKKSPEAEVKTILKDYHKALENHDINKIISFYDKDYKSTDGFNVNELKEMLEKTYSAYENIKYKTNINSINVSDDIALVQMSDKTMAVVYPTEDKELKKEKAGKLVGKSVYNVYLKKENNTWKIIQDDILMEETTLKYGFANDINMNLVIPFKIENDKNYDLSLKIDKPDDVVALASISREEITYPPIDAKEKFRKIPEAGALERVVRANNKNLDEYAVASVGLTKVSYNEEESKAKIEIVGLAYLMKRVNMNDVKNINASKTEKADNEG